MGSCRQQELESFEVYSLVGYKMTLEGHHRLNRVVEAALRGIRLVRHTEAAEAAFAVADNLLVDFVGIPDWPAVDIEKLVGSGTVVAAAAVAVDTGIAERTPPPRNLVPLDQMHQVRYQTKD